MSLMRTLAKVAIGVAVAKGASRMMNRSGSSGSGGGLGGLLGGLNAGSPGTGQPYSAGAGGGVQDMLGGLLGGAGAGQGGGLGGLLESLGGTQGGGGGLQNMLGGLAGVAGAGGLLGGLTGQMGNRPASNNADFGTVLNSAFDETPEPEIEPTADQEAAAALMLKAMIQAAKSDGELDDAEQEKLIGQLGGDVDQEEAAFVQAEMRAPVDVDALVGQTPQGMGPQIYAVSLLAIDLDSEAEAQYLHKLARGFGLDATQVNDIHAQLGVPSLYA
ncbi:MAG: DUF533 domain-containing protein [Paracoccaceae bacterium]